MTVPDLSLEAVTADAPQSRYRMAVLELCGRSGDPCWCQVGALGWLCSCRLCVDPGNRVAMLQSLVILGLERRGRMEFAAGKAVLEALVARGWGPGVVWDRGRRRGRREDRRVELHATVERSGVDD